MKENKRNKKLKKKKKENSLQQFCKKQSQLINQNAG